MKKAFLVALVVMMSILFAACVYAEGTATAYLADKKTVYFGHYPQKYTEMKTDKGDDVFSFSFLLDPIEWTVLKEDGDQVLLLSKYPLDYQKYNEKKEKQHWATSTLRKWLNSEFISKAFDAKEAEAILTTEISTGGETIYSDWDVSAARKSNDKVFLLSYSEYKNYIKDSKIEVNDYVDAKGAGKIFSTDDTWWLRSPGKNEEEACFAGHSKIESGWISDTRCIRPAIWIDKTKVDWQDNPYVKISQARTLVRDGQMMEAAAITDKLTEYREAACLSVLCRVNYAKQAYEKEDYTETITRYRTAKDYINEHFGEGEDALAPDLINGFEINSRLLESKYNLAIQAKEAGEIKKAIEMFTDVGQYKNSMQYLRECFDKAHIQYSWLTRSDAVVNTGLDNGYEKKDPIKNNDPHFGWSLGRFMMSGYTEVKQNADGPVFMKTPGDNLILWFDLNENIDALNNNSDLFINNDDNGYDLQFQISKSDFGKGNLLIRHVDFRNSDSKVQQYTNYLLAHEDTGANTKVEIREEGTYQVALDYEIAKKSFLRNEYNNYRIYFTFSVRNGSGMFFMFDIATGSELQDYSRTSDGFRIDLANSHSLSVSYIRYALNQDETGLDVRKTGLASDGETLEKVGYYEITVTNKETGEELTKHIFVGRMADLEDYQAVDESLKKFSN